MQASTQIQREEDKRVSRMDKAERRYYDKYDRRGFIHYIAPVTSSIDASDAIGLVSNYVVAYRSLHCTCNRPLRKHDKVLVTNAHGSLGRALIELSILAGASVVFGVSPPKYQERLAKWGATHLDENMYLEWSDLLLGSVDVVIDTDAGNASSAAPLVANQGTGKLVRILTGPNAGGDVKIWRKKNSLMDQPIKTCFYDIFNDMEEDPSGFRMDLQRLFDMMYRQEIKPKKKKAIPLMGVSYIELKFERFPQQQAQLRQPQTISESLTVSPSHTHASKRSKSNIPVRSSDNLGRIARNKSTSHPMDPDDDDRSTISGSSFRQRIGSRIRRSSSRGRSAPRTRSGWGNLTDSQAARQRLNTDQSVQSSHSERSRNGERNKSNIRGGDMAVRSRGSSTSERAKSAQRTHNNSLDDDIENTVRQRMRDDMAKKRVSTDHRSKSAPRTRGNRDDVRLSGQNNMKSGRTNRSESVGQQRWNDENNGSRGNEGSLDYLQQNSRKEKKEAKIFDFNFW